MKVNYKETVFVRWHYLFRRAISFPMSKLWALGNTLCPRTNTRAHFHARPNGGYCAFYYIFITCDFKLNSRCALSRIWNHAYDFRQSSITIIYRSNNFCSTRSSENWGISLGYSPVLAGIRNALKPIACGRKYLMDYRSRDLSANKIFHKKIMENSTV